jgi:4'-phosphopantetheinyl transferase
MTTPPTPLATSATPPQTPPASPLLTRAAPGVWVLLAHGCPPEGRLTEDDLAGAAHLTGVRAREHLAARRALRGLLAARFPEACRAPVTHTRLGRPRLAGWPRIGVSVSHDGDAVAACAALDHAVGLDVQHAPQDLPDSLVRRCARERAEELNRLPRQRRSWEFAWMWTVQEACVKAAGTGLSGRPWAIDVPLPAAHGAWRGYRWVSLRRHATVPLSCAWAPLPAPRTEPEAP